MCETKHKDTIQVCVINCVRNYNLPSVIMASTYIRRVLVLNIILSLIYLINGQAQNVPKVKFQAFQPKGFRAYIDDVPNLTLFIFNANVNKPLDSSEGGSLSGEIHSAVNKKWMFHDCDLQLSVGDVIYYNILVAYETNGYSNYNRNYMKNGQTHTITELDDLFGKADPDELPPDPNCGNTLTKIYGGRKACAGQTIFEENFDSLRENYWKVEQYIPVHHNEAPFVTYQRLRSNPTVTVENGNLRIAPELQQNVKGYNEDSITAGEINLVNGCTSEVESCFKEALGPDILPPIVSGRVTSRDFAFKYGTIHVRAKLPLGDWLYPEILLEPIQKNKYGREHFASGVLKIACSRGNNQLNTSQLLYGNEVLYGGPIMDYKCSRHLLNHKRLPNKRRWGDEFHVYSLRWAPDGITLSLDGTDWARVTPTRTGLAGWLGPECRGPRRPLHNYLHAPKIAPFDDYFYIALGVAAGGITEFPDGSHTTGGREKPWTNSGRKALVNFWQDMSNWISTWDDPELLVDYVKVVALESD